MARRICKACSPIIPRCAAPLLFGVNVIPWEIPEQFQRITLDFRFTGTYVSEGRDYSELFDALGSSDAPSLRLPNYAEYQSNPACNANGLNATGGACPPSVVNPQSQKVYFSGVTDVQAHGQYRLSTEFTWQAGEYIKFHLGGGYTPGAIALHHLRSGVQSGLLERQRQGRAVP